MTIQEEFKGYCFPNKNDPWHTPAIKLIGPEAAVTYANLQKKIFQEVLITDSGDLTVIHAIDGKIIFPVKE